jgi:spermidine/putrescine transport system substrate-binding protein
MRRRTFLIGAASGAFGTAACSRRPRLNVFNWSDYVAPDTISNFEREFAIQVRYQTYENSQEMLAKVMSGNSGWDVVFPANSFIGPMRQMGLLAPLRAELLPNLDNLDQVFRRPPWDPELQWSVPYMWGVTGIAYQSRLDPAPRRWRDLWDPRLAGKITMLGEAGDVFGAALKMLGYSINSGDPAELERAKRALIEQKRWLRAYVDAEVRDQLAAGDVVAAQVWATTAAQAIQAVPGKLAFAFPEEGFSRYADTMAILRESRRQEGAHQFINYMLRPEVAEQIVRAEQTATTNGKSRALRENYVLYPPAEILARAEWDEPLPAEVLRLRDRLWTEIKST